MNGGEKMYYSIIALLFIIIVMFGVIIEQKKKYKFELARKNREIALIMKKYNFYKNEYEELQKTYKTNIEISAANDFEPFDKMKYNPIYKGKKALVGDYLACSYIFTKKALESLGFEVTIVHTKAEVIRRIKNNEKYDIIFSNNVYDDGSGPQCFEELKKIEGFNTPVVIHTVTKNAKFHFVVELGFDGYIEKPVTQSKLIPVLEKLLQGGNNETKNI